MVAKGIISGSYLDLGTVHKYAQFCHMSRAPDDCHQRSSGLNSLHQNAPLVHTTKGVRICIPYVHIATDSQVLVGRHQGSNTEYPSLQCWL